MVTGAATSGIRAAEATIGLLRDTAAALAGARTMDDMLRQCTEAVVAWQGAAFARVWVLDEGGDVLSLRASAGLYTHTDGAHSRIPVGAFKIGGIAAERAPHLTNDVANDDQVTDPEWAQREGMVSFAGYPLLVVDELVGVLALFSREPLSEATLDALATVADALALGVRRLQVEEARRAEGEVVDVLYRAGASIAGVHRLESVVQTAVDAATSLTDARFGAFFYTALDERGATSMRSALSGVDDDAFSALPLNVFGGTEVVRVADVTAGRRYGRIPPYRSYLAVPVILRTGDVIGNLVLGHEGVGAFDERAERIAVGIAGHAAAAVEAVRLYQAEHRLALAFQRALLPSASPVMPGARAAARYIPASDYAEIGGDWFDVSTLPDGRVALTVGDVVGHDLGAALAMSRIRNAVQLYALDGHEPAEALFRAERFMAAAGIDVLATVLHGVYEPDTRRLALVRAGHLPPLFVGAGGAVGWMWLPELEGVMLGVDSGVRRPTARVQLEPGDMLLFVTDGLLERRDESVEVGMARVEELVRAHRTADPDVLCDLLVERFTIAGQQADDVALLALAVD